jgi:hypothetical protein
MALWQKSVVMKMPFSEILKKTSLLLKFKLNFLIKKPVGKLTIMKMRKMLDCQLKSGM